MGDKVPKKSNIRVALDPTPYILNGDKYCWWLTVMRAKKDNPFEIIESPSLGYYSSPGDCLRSLPHKILGDADVTDIKVLIDSVESLENTIVVMADAINERFKDACR